MTKLEKIIIGIISMLFILFSINLLYKISTVEFEYIKLKEEIFNLQIEMEALGLKNCSTVTITAYSPRKCETDDSPETTACLSLVKEGDVAISRDLFLKGWTFGKRIYIYQYGVFTITDLMNKRHQKSLDIFMWNTSNAVRFGKKENIFVCLLE